MTATDGWETIKGQIAALSHRDLVKVGKMLNGGSLGFDYQKVGKEGLAAKVRGFAFKAAEAKPGWNKFDAEAKNVAYAAVSGDIRALLLADQDETPDEELFPEENGEAESDEGGEVDAATLKALAKLLKPRKPAPALDMGKVRELVTQEVARQSAVYRVEVKLPDRPVITGDAEPRHEVFPELLGAVSAGLNVLLVGPAGAGKTHLGLQVARALGRRFGFSGAIGSEFKLLGFTDAQGRTVRTVYREFYEHGGVFLKDEIDGSSPNALLALNAGMANGHQDFPDAIVERHPEFSLIASANTYGHGADRQYVGRNQLDAASLDRFYVIPMGYDEKLERTLYGDSDWVGFVQRVRHAVKAAGVRHVVSMRASEMGVKALASGLDRAAMERALVWKHLSEADIAKVRAAM